MAGRKKELQGLSGGLSETCSADFVWPLAQSLVQVSTTQLWLQGLRCCAAAALHSGCELVSQSITPCFVCLEYGRSTRDLTQSGGAKAAPHAVWRGSAELAGLALTAVLHLQLILCSSLVLSSAIKRT